MTVLTCYQASDEEVSLAELTRRTGLAKSTIMRLLAELSAWGMVERSGGGWRLGTQLFELGQMAPRSRELREAAMPFLNDLHASTRETVHLAILQGVDVVYIEKLARLGSPALPSRVGGRMWPYCTAVGKALLAFSSESLVRTIVTNGFERRTPYTIVAPNLLLKQLQEIRGRGIAYDWQESTVGVTCIASPVLDSAGEPIAAVSVSGSSNRLYGDRLEAIVQATARRVSQRLMANAIRWPSVGAAQNELSNSAHRSRVTA